MKLVGVDLILTRIQWLFVNWHLNFRAAVRDSKRSFLVVESPNDGCAVLFEINQLVS